MSLARFATRHITAIIFSTAVLCVLGVFVLGSFPVSILPDITFPRVVVIGEAGETPVRMMEAGVVRPLEEAIAMVPGITRVRSKTQRGSTEISVDFQWGTDMITAQQLVSTRINEVRAQLPTDVSVSVERMNPTVFPILGLSVKCPGLTPDELWTLATYKLKPRLARVPGVARVVVQGGRIPDIAVDVRPDRLAAYHLSIMDVVQALRQSNIVTAVGRLDRRYQQYQVIVSGEAASADQPASVVVAERNGIPISLGQIAAVHPSLEDRTTIVTADGAESVLINIVRQPSANTVSVVEAVNREIAALKPSLPPGTELGVWYDQSHLVREAVASVRDAVLIGAGLAVLVLMAFLGDLRATLVTASIIPVTLLITFLLMRMAGITLNLMTLGALAVGIGLVIDDAIVVVENVFRHLSRGEERSAVVAAASAEIAAPMISAALTTVVVFLPLVLLSGVAGAFFTALAVTLALALMVSLALALLLSPSLCAAFLRTRPGAPEHGRLFELVVRGYERVLQVGLKRRWILPMSIGVIIALIGLLATRLGTGFMPAMDEGAFILDYWTPPGTSLAESDRLLRKIEGILRSTPEVAAYSRRTGTELGFAITEPNRGDIAVELKPNRRRNIEQIMDDVRGRIAGQVPGVRVDFIQVLQDLIGDLSGSVAPIELKLFGESQQQLAELAPRLADKLAGIPGVVDVKSGIVEAGPELIFRVDPIRAGRVGLTPADVADQAHAALLGDVATRLLIGDRTLPVRVRFPLAFRSRKSTIEQALVRTPVGSTVPLASLGTFETVPGATELNREDQRRLITVSARISGRDLGSIMADVQKMMRAFPLPAGVTYDIAGDYKSQQESFLNFLEVLGLAVLLVFTVMVFHFGRFVQPLVMLLMMPLSLFGVVFGLWITGTPLNVSSFMGAIMLVGIVMKDGILLLDRARHAEQEGSSVQNAVLMAGRVRLRPILMTTLTAILGLVPLALGLGAGAEMQKPLAIAVIGGLSFSTLFTLILGPLLYAEVRRLSSRLSRH